MAEIIELHKEEESEEEMIPVDQWDGSCWKSVWEQFFVPVAEKQGVDPWDVLAGFMQNLLQKVGEE